MIFYRSRKNDNHSRDRDAGEDIAEVLGFGRTSGCLLQIEQVIDKDESSKGALLEESLSIKNFNGC